MSSNVPERISNLLLLIKADTTGPAYERVVLVEQLISDSCKSHAQLVEALEWYREKAAAIARYMERKQVDPQLAVMHELSLDAGKRAQAAIAAARQEAG